MLRVASLRVATSVLAGVAAAAAPLGVAHADTLTRVDLRVLVVDDGGPSVAAIVDELRTEGTPFTTVELSDPGRPTIDTAFLSDTVAGGAERAKFQAVVLPNSDSSFPTGSPEMSAIASYEQKFGVRQVDAYTYAQPAVGLNWAADPGYIGTLDGVTGAVTAAGSTGPFGYLQGPVPFEDNDPAVVESYGYLATPLAAQAPGASFTTFVDAPIPGTGGTRGVLAGQYDHDGRSELVLTFAYNKYQQQYRLLARGIVDWATRGVHLGYDRNYFSVNVDDMFLPDDRWSSTAKCTPGDATSTCRGPVSTTPIRMNAGDVAFAKNWEAANGFTFDFMFNAGGSDDITSTGADDPLTGALLADKAAFRWVNHTYSHPFLGCLQNTTTVPWSCALDDGGNLLWESRYNIVTDIRQNIAWANAHGLPIDVSELVTGEHSGLAVLPQQPVDNPNLATSLAALGIKWTGSDHSREPNQRALGTALTVPRFPMNIYYNAGKAADEVDEYNWIYTSVAQGGSGACTADPASTCLPAPLDLATGFQNYIVPLEARIDLGHVLGNNPMPHYAHQSNLAEDRVLYPVLDQILTDYRQLFTAQTPLLNPRFSQIGQELNQRAQWAAALQSSDSGAANVTAFRVGTTVVVQAPAGVAVPLTTPDGTTVNTVAGPVPFGSAYAGELSGWASPTAAGSSVGLQLHDPGPAAMHRPAPSTPATTWAWLVPPPGIPASTTPYVPAGVRRQVPLTPAGVRRLAAAHPSPPRQHSLHAG